MKKLFISLILCTVLIFTFGFVIATDITTEKISNITYIEELRTTDTIRIPDTGILIWKDYKSYYSNDKRILIEDYNYDVKLDFKLLTDYNENTIVSNDTKIASLFFTEWEDGRTKIVDEIELYNKNQNYKTEKKDIWFKYANITTNYIPAPSTSKNLTASSFYYNTTEWIQFDSLDDLPHNNIEVGIFTETFLGDNYEWVITVDKFEILEWASFLATDTERYFNMSDNAANTVVLDGTGTTNGVASFNTDDNTVTGQVGDALTLDGSGDYITMGSPAVGSSGQFTISAWVKTTSTSNDYVIGYRNDGTLDWRFLRLSGGKAQGYLRTSSSGLDNVASTTSVNDGDWHHIVWTYEAGEAIIYVDGNDENTKSMTINPGAVALEIGRDGVSDSDYLPCTIDEVGIWSRVLTPTEVNDSATSTYPFSSDSCTYTSGDWEVDCADNCVIDSAVAVGGNDIYITGTGTFRTSEDITGYGLLHIEGDNSSSICTVTCDGGCFK